MRMRRLALVLVVVLFAPSVSWSQSPGGLLGQQRAAGLSLLTVVAPPDPSQPPPPPGDDKFLCWNIWYAHTSGNEWLMLTDAPDTAEGKVFTDEAIKAITSAAKDAKWTVRRLANAAAVEAESKKVGSQLDAASKPDTGALASFKALARRIFSAKKK